MISRMRCQTGMVDCNISREARQIAHDAMSIICCRSLSNSCVTQRRCQSLCNSLWNSLWPATLQSNASIVNRQKCRACSCDLLVRSGIFNAAEDLIRINYSRQGMYDLMSDFTTVTGESLETERDKAGSIDALFLPDCFFVA